VFTGCDEVLAAVGWGFSPNEERKDAVLEILAGTFAKAGKLSQVDNVGDVTALLAGEAVAEDVVMGVDGHGARIAERRARPFGVIRVWVLVRSAPSAPWKEKTLHSK
jgi:hypothetical protein